MNLKNDSTVKLLLLIFGVSALITLAIWFFSRPEATQERNEETANLSFKNINGTAIDKITLEHSSVSLTFNRQADGWKVNNLAASEEIETFLENLSGSFIGSTASENESSFAGLGVDEEQGYLLKLYQGENGIFSALIGNQATSYKSFYARKPEDKNVYLVYGEIRPYVTRSLDQWRNKTILSVDEESVGSLSYLIGNQSFSIEKEGESWKLVRGSQRSDVNQTLLERVWLALNPLTATSFAEDGQSFNFESATNTLTLNLTDQSTLEIKEVVNGENHFFQKTGESTVYLISELTSQEIFVNPEELKQ